MENQDYNFYLMTTRVKNCLKIQFLIKLYKRISQKRGRNTDKEFKIDRKNIKNLLKNGKKE